MWAVLQDCFRAWLTKSVAAFLLPLVRVSVRLNSHDNTTSAILTLNRTRESALRDKSVAKEPNS